MLVAVLYLIHTVDPHAVKTSPVPAPIGRYPDNSLLNQRPLDVQFLQRKVLNVVASVDVVLAFADADVPTRRRYTTGRETVALNSRGGVVVIRCVDPGLKVARRGSNVPGALCGDVFDCETGGDDATRKGDGKLSFATVVEVRGCVDGGGGAPAVCLFFPALESHFWTVWWDHRPLSDSCVD